MVNIIEYCKQTIGYNPFVEEGKEKIYNEYIEKIMILAQEEPDMTKDYYVKAIIDELIIQNYIDLAAVLGVNPLYSKEENMQETSKILWKHIFGIDK